MKKNIVISGISKGIGKAIANTFHKQGFHLIGCSSNPLNLEHTQQEFPDADLEVVNFMHKEEVQAWAKHILDKYEYLEVLVNNAGIFIPGQIQNEEDGVFEKILSINLHSAYHLTRGLLLKFIAQNHGTIFNICSTASITPYVNGGSYCIAKYGLLGFSKVLREELKPHNIRVTSVLPGATLTDSWAGTNFPEQRFMKPNDLANLLWYIYQMPQNTVIEEILLRPIQGDIV